MLNSLGTAEAVFLPLRRPMTDPQTGREGYTQGAHTAGDYYVFAGSYTSGVCLDWFRQAFAAQTDHATLTAEAEQVPPGSLGVSFCPYVCAWPTRRTATLSVWAPSSVSPPMSSGARCSAP